MLSKQQTVLKKSDLVLTPKDVAFEAAYDDTHEVYQILTITQENWVEMGQPSELTLTIEPGDKLNGSGT